MFCLDGFLNKDTYFSYGHIWHLAMEWKKKECLFVCIFETGQDKESELVEKVLRRWMEQELPQVMEKETTDIQREVNRFSTWLKKWCGKEKALKEPVVCLYFQGHTYFNEAGKTVWSQFKGRRGLIIGGESTSGDKAYWEERSREILNPSASIEENANKLKTDMLVAFSRGIIKLGYFVLWEERDDL